MRKRTAIAAGTALAASGGVIAYPLFFPRWCLTRGARPGEVSRGGQLPVRLVNMLVMEPGSLIMERKMLLGIKQRAEDLARQALA